VSSASSKSREKLEPRERFLGPTEDLPLYKPARLWSWTKFILFQGVTRDCVSFEDDHIRDVHRRAVRYDNRVEHLWTYTQIASAIIMSIAHG
jgi:phosphate/sulfate permease